MGYIHPPLNVLYSHTIRIVCENKGLASKLAKAKHNGGFDRQDFAIKQVNFAHKLTAQINMYDSLL